MSFRPAEWTRNLQLLNADLVFVRASRLRWFQVFTAMTAHLEQLAAQI